MTQATLFDKRGFALDELTASYNRQWVKNAFGECKFTAAIRDVEAHPEVFAKGNLIVIKQDNLPDWVGYLDFPEPWGDGTIVFQAFSAEKIFDLRPGRPDKLFGTAGSIFNRLIGVANSWGDTLMRPGDIYLGGSDREESISYANQLYADVQRIAERSGNDWDITPQVTNGKLTLLANWYAAKRKVVDHALTEGINMEAKSSTLEYTGPVWNSVVAFGNASTWASRKLAYASDEASQANYGLRALGLAVDSNVDATVQAAADAYAAYYKNPRRSVDISATDVNGTFAWLRIGHVPDVELIGVGLDDGTKGFTMQAEIVEMNYLHDRDVMDLTVRE